MSTALAECGANIDDISQTILDDIFSMTMLTTLDTAVADFNTVQEKLEAVGENLGVQVIIQREDVFQYMYKISARPLRLMAQSAGGSHRNGARVMGGATARATREAAARRNVTRGVAARRACSMWEAAARTRHARSSRPRPYARREGGRSCDGGDSAPSHRRSRR